MTPIEELDLREALDTVWGLLSIEQINMLDPGTTHLCRNNHYKLHHEGDTHDQHHPERPGS